MNQKILFLFSNKNLWNHKVAESFMSNWGTWQDSMFINVLIGSHLGIRFGNRTDSRRRRNFVCTKEERVGT